MTDEALEIDLRGWLGEGEVVRPHPSPRVAEHGLREMIKSAAEMAKGDAPVDDKPFDLVKDRQVRASYSSARNTFPGHTT